MNANLSANQNTYADDEIDLIELWQTIWSQKLMIIFVTAVMTISAGFVAFNISKTYEAETLLLPPKNQHIAQLNIQNLGGISSTTTGNFFNQEQNSSEKSRVGISTYETTESVFSKFIANLLSYENQKAFFSEQKLAPFFTDKVSVNKTELDLFTENFKFSPAAKNATSQASSFKYQFENPQLSAQWLNDYVNFTLLKTKNELIEEIDSKIIRQKTNLLQEATALISQAKLNRQHKIIALSEALDIAKKAGITEPAINQQTILNFPEYLKGTRLLSAEIDALKTRDSDEAFIPRLNEINQNIVMLDSFKIDKNLIQVAQIDLAAKEPTTPIKPKKSLIVAVAFVLGGMLGIFIALIRGAVRKRRDTQNNASAL